MAAMMTSPLTSRVMSGQPVRAPSARATSMRVARPMVSCSAQQQSPAVGAIAAAALAAAVTFGQVDAAFADVSGLTPCSESKQFAKREKNELKALDKRLKNVRCPTVTRSLRSVVVRIEFTTYCPDDLRSLPFGLCRDTRSAYARARATIVQAHQFALSRAV